MGLNNAMFIHLFWSWHTS